MNIHKAKIKVLIAYASQYGTTAEIAEAVKTGICSYKGAFDVSMTSGPLKEGFTLQSFDLLIFGSGIYKGLISGELADMLQKYSSIICEKPTAAFIVCGTGNAQSQARYLARVKQAIPGVFLLTAFRGRLKFDELNDEHKHRIKARYKDKDFTDYDYVDLNAARNYGIKIAEIILAKDKETNEIID